MFILHCYIHQNHKIWFVHFQRVPQIFSTIPYIFFEIQQNTHNKERQNRKDENSEVKCPFFIGKNPLSHFSLERIFQR